MARFPGPLCVILKQVPPRALVDGGVSRAGPDRRLEKPGGLVARATVHTLGSKPDNGFTCLRGDWVRLDASKSSRIASQFEWSFNAEEVPVVSTGHLYTEENPPPETEVTGNKTGRIIDVQALASFTATLIVRDGMNTSAPFTLTVWVQPRKWTTPFTQRKELKTFTEFYGAHPLLERHAGENACSLCGITATGHQIHRAASAPDWKGQFKVEKVTDPGGPFDGLWYVKSADLRIDRTRYINSELTEGQVHQLNNRKGVPTVYAEGLRARIECTKRHEELHGELVKEKLHESGVDPAPRVEALIGDDQDSLLEQANTEVALKENVLGNATTGPEGHGKLRERLRQSLAATSVKFLLPQSRTDIKGVEVETDLLGFED